MYVCMYVCVHGCVCMCVCVKNTSKENVDSYHNEKLRKIAKINWNSDCTKRILIYVVVILHSTKETNTA